MISPTEDTRDSAVSFEQDDVDDASTISRREFLAFVGGAATTVTVGSILPAGTASAEAGSLRRAGISFTPVRVPHPLNIYTDRKSFLGTGVDTGTLVNASPTAQLGNYTVVDDVIVPPEFERYVIVAWGDRPFPDADDYVGYNHDFTAFIAESGDRDGLLWVNHEYTSYPFSVHATADAGLQALGDGFKQYVGFALPALPATGFIGMSANDQRLLLGEILYNVGGSVVRIRRPRSHGRFEVVKDPRNRRYHGLSGLALNTSRGLPTAWGNMPHQKGDMGYLEGTGPGATDVFAGVNADGLGNRIIGTFANCSGGHTPWGTVLSAEENFQIFGNVGVQESVLPNGSQTGFPVGTPAAAPTTASVFGLYGEKYGWLVEIDPKRPHVRAKKHTALGRFRHENVAMRVREGAPLVAYMGDDRRGGHVWKFVSDDRIRDEDDASNSRLFEAGTLYAARLNADGTGTWIPLKLSTPTNPNVPSELGSAELAARGVIDRDAGTRFPRRVGVAGQTADGGSFVMTRTNEAASLPGYRNKTLAQFYQSQGAALCDAFLAANLIGATPCGRPEDIEVHPRTNDVFMAMTDGIAGGDGYPDSRIFQVGKYTAAIDAKQPPGGLYRIREKSRDGAGTEFTWSVFAAGGEEGAVDGMGFAAVDNLVFDRNASVWGVIDMSTEKHNGYSDGSNPVAQTIDHTLTTPANASNFFGIYGNNFMFYIPTSKGDPDAGRVVPFAIGPTRSEMTGPTFAGNTLIVSVQHPGEDSPIGTQTPLRRNIEILALDGKSVFNQDRTIPKGSAWPSSIATRDGGAGSAAGLPRPATIGIRPKKGRAPWQDSDD